MNTGKRHMIPHLQTFDFTLFASAGWKQGEVVRGVESVVMSETKPENHGGLYKLSTPRTLRQIGKDGALKASIW